ncbi:MAG: DUF255 domain-containing protein [Verrucomicrobia bacterium]|nr:MAG: DUF255 domain-containing protein [Verrucomicrobiota bacterium]
MTRIVRCLLALVIVVGSARAEFEDPFITAASAVSSAASLVAEASAIAPGKAFTLALRLEHPAGWHSYYKNSGGIELPPVIEWQLPAGFSAGPIQWPVPAIKDGYSGKSFVYTGTLVLLVDITPPATLQVDEKVPLRAKATWQICSDTCMNEEKSFALSLPVSASAVTDPAQADLFAMARGKIPRPNETWKLSAYPDAGHCVLRLSPQAGVDSPPLPPVEFIPNEPFLKPLSDGGSVTRVGADWLITLKRNAVDIFEKPIPLGKALSGILLSGKTGGADAAATVIDEIPLAAAPAKPLAFVRLLGILGLMFVGGLILNLMPCVFPVIGLKIMGFVKQAGDSRQRIVAHGLLFTLGVLVSFGVLSGILFAGRAVAGVGWGYQLQIPGVVLGLMLLMFVLALNMFGVFELGTAATSVGGSLQAKHGLAGTFFSGVLATVVATPCAGPFLGAAIGAAITLPALAFFAAFAAMAIGLALPYLVLSVFPGLLYLLPRPGAWMESFKQGMSFLLFATSGYFLCIYAVQIGSENLLDPVLGLSTIAMAAWIYGRWCLPHRRPAVRRAALVITLALAAGGVLLALPPTPKADALHWEAWSQARVDEVLENDQPVYIDFTAQWCPTCQVNKRLAYTPAVIALMQAKHIVALKADKTKLNPEIETKLREYGRSAIPVNVLLVPGKAPIVTPELLSAAYLTELFRREVPNLVADTNEK